jgi:hypothetical protein
LTAANEWTGLITKAHTSAFVATATTNTVKKLTCWNCGTAGHSLTEYPRPPNSTLVKKNKKAYKEFKSKNKTNKKDDKDKASPTGKWAPPSAREQNRRIIDGTARYWISKTKLWANNRKVEGFAAVAVAATTGPATVVPATPAPISTVGTDSVATTSKELAIANTAHTIQLAMQGLLLTLIN